MDEQLRKFKEEVIVMMKKQDTEHKLEIQTLKDRVHILEQQKAEQT